MFLGLKPISANLTASKVEEVFVPEGLGDGSLARSAWKSVPRSARPARDGMIVAPEGCLLPDVVTARADCAADRCTSPLGKLT
jgi:hypothetical protein